MSCRVTACAQCCAELGNGLCATCLPSCKILLATATPPVADMNAFYKLPDRCECHGMRSLGEAHDAAHCCTPYVDHLLPLTMHFLFSSLSRTFAIGRSSRSIFFCRLQLCCWRSLWCCWPNAPRRANVVAIATAGAYSRASSNHAHSPSCFCIFFGGLGCSDTPQQKTAARPTASSTR